MALKDWKEDIISPTLILFISRLRAISIQQIYKGRWIVRTPLKPNKFFKSKSQALKFAKSYMRKH